MFGYIKPYVPQLRVSEHECWRAVYCGLCKYMGRHICADSALALSYDAAFLALVRLAATGEATHFTNRRCALHPVKKRPMLEPCEALRYSASVGALLVYHKLADDVADEGRLSRRLLMPEAKRLRRKAGMAALDSEITARLDTLYSAEKEASGSGAVSVDRLAELSGGVTALIFAYGLDGRTARVASELGRRIGRWVYLADAVADREKDAKTSAFNPFLIGKPAIAPSADEPAATGSPTDNPTADSMVADSMVADSLSADSMADGFDRSSTAAALALERKAAEGALNLLGCADSGIEAILRNIITLGMGAVEDKLLGTPETCPKS